MRAHLHEAEAAASRRRFVNGRARRRLNAFTAILGGCAAFWPENNGGSHRVFVLLFSAMTESGGIAEKHHRQCPLFRQTTVCGQIDKQTTLCHPMAPAFLSPRQLGRLMETRPCAVQLVDCRSFLNYNADRITGSVNIFCPPLVKKRFSKSVLPLHTMLSAETRATLCRSGVDVVVLYDDDTNEERWQSRRCDLQLIMDSLKAFLKQWPLTYYVLAGKSGSWLRNVPPATDPRRRLSCCHRKKNLQITLQL